jgi:5-methylcytosine-specific restriction endonuclease McrA
MRQAFTCLYCGLTFTDSFKPSRPRKYCSNTCQHAKQRNDKIAAGSMHAKSIKKILIQRHGHYCWGCNLSQWLGKPITLEIEHVNGNNGDNALSNLKILCPNCHAQTDTYKGKNLGRGAISRQAALDRLENGARRGKAALPN